MLTRVDDGMIDFAEQLRRRAGTLTGLRDLSSAVLAKLPFLPGVTEVHSTAGEAFEAGNGVCQDHAHVFIGCCRHLGIPARYVVGYIFTGNTESRAQSDASHAWVQLYIPNIGWKGFDPTNGVLPETNHIRVAYGRHYLDATPTEGTLYSRAEETMTLEVEVNEEPRPVPAHAT